MTDRDNNAGLQLFERNSTLPWVNLVTPKSVLSKVTNDVIMTGSIGTLSLSFVNEFVYLWSNTMLRYSWKLDTHTQEGIRIQQSKYIRVQTLGHTFFFVSRRIASRIHEISDLKKSSRAQS